MNQNCVKNHTPKRHGHRHGFWPAANIRKTSEAYILDLVLPGWTRDELSIDVEDKILTISGKAEALERDESVEYTLRNFVKRSFKRSFALGNDMDQDHIQAKMENGILEVVIPQLEKETYKINIQ